MTPIAQTSLEGELIWGLGLGLEEVGKAYTGFPCPVFLKISGAM